LGRLTNVEKARRAMEAANAPPLTGAISTDPVRPQIKQMTGFETAEEMRAALPENTSLGSPPMDGYTPAPKRSRRSKEEMAAARAAAGLDVDDPNMLDPRYKKAVENMRSGGLTTAVQAGFKTYAVVSKEPSWELQPDEDQKVDDFSYVLSKKYGVLDPTKHWIGMAFYFVALMGTLIFKRAAKLNAESWMKKLHGFFSSTEDETEKPEQKQPKQSEG
jgi:hypothetical protein